MASILCDIATCINSWYDPSDSMMHSCLGKNVLRTHFDVYNSQLMKESIDPNFHSTPKGKMKLIAISLSIDPL